MLSKLAISLVITFCLSLASGGDSPSPHRLRFGTLEMTPLAEKAFIFRSDGIEEAFDRSAKAILGASGIPFYDLPGLTEIGFVTKGGARFEYDNSPKQIYLSKFIQEHPSEKIVAILFEGLLSEKLEVKTQGLTAVCRVDVDFGGGIKTLWKNLPEQYAQGVIKGSDAKMLKGKVRGVK